MKENRIYSAVVFGLIISVLVVSLMMILGNQEQPRKKVSVVVTNSESSRWTAFRQGLNQAARDNNIELNFVTTTELVSVRQEQRLISRELQNGADGIITEMRASADMSDFVAEVTSKAALELVATGVEADADVGGRYAYVGPDNRKLGEALAEELIADFGAALSTQRIGLVAGNVQQSAIQERQTALKEKLQAAGARIVWELEGQEEDMQEAIRRSSTRGVTDVIVALDNDCTEDVVDYITGTDRQYIAVYGVGNSDKLVYSMDQGYIRGMIVPEEFNMGYRSLEDLSQRLDYQKFSLQNREIDFRVIRRENMYSDENQRLLFPLIQ